MAEEPPATKGRRARNADDTRQTYGSHEAEVSHEMRHEPQSEREHAVDTLSYEEARSRLVEIVAQLEQGAIPLEKSLRLWELGEQLARHCQAWLDGARQRLNAAAEAGDPHSDDSGSAAGLTASGSVSGGAGTSVTPGTRANAEDTNASTSANPEDACGEPNAGTNRRDIASPTGTANASKANARSSKPSGVDAGPAGKEQL